MQQISISGSCQSTSTRSLYQALVSRSARTTCARSLYQDPSGPLYRDLLDHCLRILWNILCKISVSGCVCEDPFDHLYQDPIGPLAQDLVSGCCRTANARFGSPDLQFSRKSRAKRSFWKSGSAVFEEVSHKTLLLELRIFRVPFSRKSRIRRSFWKPGSSVFEEVSQNLLVYKILMQVVQKDPNRDPETEILQKWFYRILIEVVLQDLKQRSCTRCSIGS